MKNRIFSIMDRRKKKAGAAILCGALLLTLGTGFAFAANVHAPQPEIPQDNPLMVTPWIAIDGFIPSPDIYAPYAAFGITLSADGQSLLYKGQPVRQFVDEKREKGSGKISKSGQTNMSNTSPLALPIPQRTRPSILTASG